MEVLITGANGFVGSEIVRRLVEDGVHNASGTCRSDPDKYSQNFLNLIALGDVNNETNWGRALANKNVVIHTAARVHVMKESEKDPLASFREVNVKGTLNLARQSAAAGVTRFVFISSVKVHGEQTKPGVPVSEESDLEPVDPYGVSKYEAEIGLKEISQQTGMELVIVRPPLVYGPGVKANFEKMLRWIYKGVPLPLKSIKNTRSLVGLDNFVDFLVLCIDHPAVANEAFLITDQHDVSVPELLRLQAAAIGYKANLFPLPLTLLKIIASMAGQGQAVQRLVEDLAIDSSKATRVVGWTPPFSLEFGLTKTAKHFLKSIDSKHGGSSL